MSPEQDRRPVWLRRASDRIRSEVVTITNNLKKDNLWQRMVKVSLAVIISIIVVLIPPVTALFPLTAFLAPMTTVFAHAGQRVGLVVEGWVMLITGAVTGTAWATLGLWLSSLVYDRNEQAAYAIRAIFLLFSVFHHGYLRSNSPRLIVHILFALTTSTVILSSSSTRVTSQLIASVAYPILIGAAAVILCNGLLFPELSCDYLVATTVSTIDDTTNILTRSTAWFLQHNEQHLGSHDLELVSTAPVVTELGRSSTGNRNMTKSAHPAWYQKIFTAFQSPFRGSQYRARKQAILRPAPSEAISLATLTESKVLLRGKLRRCKAGQSEVNLEISIAPLPPKRLKLVSTIFMKGLVHNTISLISACENKFVLLGDWMDLHANKDGENSEDDTSSDHTVSDDSSTRTKSHADTHRSSASLLRDHLRKLELVKPIREIEAGDPEVLDAMISRIRGPAEDFMRAIRLASKSVTRSLSYCYGLKRLPSGGRTPSAISLEEMDSRIDAFTDAIKRFDYRSTEELEQTATGINGKSDFMPRMETFLVSSFVLGLRQAGIQYLQMLRHSRSLVEQRHATRFRLSLHVPGTTGWRAWLSSGGEKDGMVLPVTARKLNRQGKDTSEKGQDIRAEQEATATELEKPFSHQRADEENNLRPGRPERAEMSISFKEQKRARQDRAKIRASKLRKNSRARAATAFEWLQRSDDTIYALKLVIAFFIISWPGFVPEWKPWYTSVHGVWAPLQLVLIFEVVIGTSLFVFVIRLVGVIFGCLVGFLAFEIGGGNRIVMAVVLLLGVVPSVYIQLGTKYLKTGMVALTSMSAVALTTVGAEQIAYKNFYLRLLTFFIGSSIGLAVELVLYPARARDRMVESLSSCINQLSVMQAVLAVGVDKPTKLNFLSEKLRKRFESSRDKAQAALGAAEMFLPFCLTEPRLKGNFRYIHPIYKEIIYVLNQIVDRMDNIIQLRRAYGNAVLEELNEQVHVYRRAVAASMAISLFAVDDALTTRMPLPQFLPSARVAELRLINRVGEILRAKGSENEGQQQEEHEQHGGENSVQTHGVYSRNEQGDSAAAMSSREWDTRMARVAEYHKYLSWNANAAGLMEIIEFLEELVELAKLLVGVNAFRSGLLERPTFMDYARQTNQWSDGAEKGGKGKQVWSSGALPPAAGTTAAVEPGKQTRRLTGPLHQPPGLRRRGTGAQSHDGTVADGGRDGGQGPAEGDEGDGDEAADVATDLKRSSTRGSKSRGTGGNKAQEEHAVDGDFEIPISLQRVSTRRSAIRRRGTGLSER